MFRGIVTLVLFVCVFCQSQADDVPETLVTCSAWGDPHVTRFPSDENDKVTEVWCQEAGWKVLLENDHIKTNVLVSQKPYVFNEFNMEFFNENRDSFCPLSDKQFVLPLPEDCGEDITITRNGNFLTIRDKKHDITVTVQRYDYNLGHAYSITSVQPAYLVDTSKGLCKTSCDPNSGKALERLRRALSSSHQDLIKKSAEGICEIAISKLVPKFKIILLHQMAKETQNAYSACVTDVRLTGDLTFAKQSVSNLAINLATKNLPAKTNLQPILDKVYSLIDELNPRIDSALSQFMTPKKPTPNKDDETVVYHEEKDASISCLRTYAGVITITSATYESRTSSCSVDVTARVKHICASSPRSCKFNVSNTVLQHDPCNDEPKQLKITFQCIKRN